VNTIDRIAAILKGANYKELAKPFAVSSLPFEFAAAFIGNERALDLIVVVDLFVEKDEARLVQKIQSLGRALDLAESRRSLTAVLVGTGLDIASLEAISRICRVLPVGTPSDDPSIDQYLHDWLAVLLPLPVIEGVAALADWRTELTSQVGDGSSTSVFGAIVEAAHQGSDSVEKVLASRVQKEVAKPLREQSQ
jgi:hypothetical protein